MEPTDADAYFGQVLRGAPSGTRLARSQALRTYFEFLELRHKVELHQLTGRVIGCPIDELNRPRGSKDARLRIPPRAEELATFFAGWAAELASCRKFAPSARNYAAAKLMAAVGLRVNEVRRLDLADIKWELGPFGKLHVRYGKGARGSGPRERMVPLVNHADRTLRWFIQDLWGSCGGGEHTRHGAPLRRTRRGRWRGIKRGTMRAPEASTIRPDGVVNGVGAGRPQRRSRVHLLGSWPRRRNACGTRPAAAPHSSPYQPGCSSSVWDIPLPCP